jgi:EmrB/QacA subfamily drug resistance transporter
LAADRPAEPVTDIRGGDRTNHGTGDDGTGEAAASKGMLLFAVLGAMFAVNMTFTIFNVVLDQIATDLHTTQSTVTWAITGPLLAVGIAAPALGKLGDMHGHRRLFLIALGTAVLSALLTAGAWNAEVLIAARVISGIQGAALTASSWSLLFRVYGPTERAKVLGWWSLVTAGGPVLGVALGGPFVQAVGWRWIFVVQAGLIAATYVVCTRVLSETPKQAAARLDLGGAATLGLGIGGILYALNEGGTAGWGSVLVVVPALVGAGLLVGFVMVERRVESPLFPLAWLSRPNFLFPCLAGFGLNFAYMGAFFLTPLFFERALGYSVAATALLQVVRPLVLAVSAPAAGYMADRRGERFVTLLGCLAMAASMICFYALRPGSGVVLILAGLVFAGLANGVSYPAIAASVANSIEPELMGTASGGLQVASQIGTVAGIQVMESIQVARQHGAGVAGSFSEAFLAGLVLVGLAAVAAGFMRPTARRARRTGRAGRAAAVVAEARPSITELTGEAPAM